MKFRKLISVLCIFVMINTSLAGAYGTVDPNYQTTVTEDQVLPFEVPSRQLDPEDFSRQLNPASFYAYSDVYQGSYYSELSSSQKSFYNEFKEAYLDSSDMPNGKSETVMLSPANTVWVSINSEGTDFTQESKNKLKALDDDIVYAYFALLNDYPSLFWAGSLEWIYQFAGSGTEFYVYSIEVTATERYSDALSSTEDFIKGVNSAVTEIDATRVNNDEYYTLKAIHDYLCKKITYNYAALENPDEPAYDYAYSPGPVFTETNPSVVCEGYGKAFKILCDSYDIPCVLVVGIGNGGYHLWNYVQIDEKWYAVDVTWDDQYIIMYDYFLVGEDGMSDHEPLNNIFTTDISYTYAYPELNETAYIYSPPADFCEHNWVKGETLVAPTCTSAGTIQYNCILCSDSKTIEEPALGHETSDTWTINPATVSSNGQKYKECSRCEEKTSLSTIYKIDSVKLSKTAYTYDGEKKTPSVTVYDAQGNKLVKDTDYTVKYSSTKRTAVGKYTVTVTFKGNYSGSKQLDFTIGPKNPTTVKAYLCGYDDVKVSWSKVTGASGYKVYYKKASDSKYTYLKTTTNNYCKKSDLVDGVKYYFKIVTCKTKDGNECPNAGKTASVYTLKKVKDVKATTSGSKVKISWSNISAETGYQISRSSSSTGTYIVATYETTTGTYKTVSATAGKTYYYKVRAYKVVNGETIYAPWSSVVEYKRSSSAS